MKDSSLTTHEHKKEKNHLFPIFLKLHELHTLIIGGQYVGFEKLNAILTNSPRASVTLVALEISDHRKLYRKIIKRTKKK